MTHADVITLIKSCPRTLSDAKLVETHISWVILTEKYAYKIKKPVQYSFLDFSTLEKRKFCCERELVLNRRLTTGIYLDVVPIYQSEDVLQLDGTHSDLKDYAVKMKRLPGDRQMNLLLEDEKVESHHIEQLAEQLASFHMSTDVVILHPDLKGMQRDFADLLRIAPFVEKHWGADATLNLHKAEEYSAFTLQALRERIYERHLEGFTVDGHGDLHAKNIFLLDEPVIFDCIEFNDHLRKLDVLNEIAFLCMDLDFYGKPGLSDQLLEAYNSRYVCVYNSTDEQLFNYYKLYRANVRLKINAMSAMQMEEGPELHKQLALVSSYLDLFAAYLEE